MHVITKWKVTFIKSGSDNPNSKTTFDIDNDFYGNVLETLAKINCGVDITKITIERVYPQSARIGVTTSNLSGEVWK